MKVNNNSASAINLPEDISYGSAWRMIFAWKSVGYDAQVAGDDGMRLAAYIMWDKEGNPYWFMEADSHPAQGIWSQKNTVDTTMLSNQEWFLT